MNNLLEHIKLLIKKNNFLYSVLKPFIGFIRKCFDFILRNRSLLIIKSSSKYKNIFIFDARNNSILFDSVFLLLRASNFFYNDKWSIIIYEDDLYRYADKVVSKEIYFNNFVSIFLQSLLILPNPPITIKFVKDNYKLLKIIRNSNKIFPENYSYLSETNAYSVTDFNEKDFQNFRINQPIMKFTKYHSEIFENFLNYRNIKEYVTITIRTKNWSNSDWNTNIDDIKLYIDFIKKNNLNKFDILILPDTERDIPKEIMDFIQKNDLKYHIFIQGSFSIPIRFLTYSKASFNFASNNGPTAMLLLIKNNTFYISKDQHQGDDIEKFVQKFNKDIFLDRKFIFNKRYLKKTKN
ncbi:hypothetical protein N8852_01325 [Candidatus Pelagibacter ubique]|nr:hypothetical protein [Candidatus Pelagibacter ubique]|tara:strand:+ start:546 stop:1598 length:1053 start_codon:yes stop_codon:yes gene_type:complete